MKKTRFEKELVQAGKELKRIAEGKLVPQPLDKVIAEMRTKHGGKRAVPNGKLEMKKAH